MNKVQNVLPCVFFKIPRNLHGFVALAHLMDFHVHCDMMGNPFLPRPWIPLLEIRMNAERKLEMQRDLEKKEMVRKTQKKSGHGYHVSGPHLFYTNDLIESAVLRITFINASIEGKPKLWVVNP